MKIVSKIVLASSILFALAFTFSCSSDDDKGDWLTCQELESLLDKCDSEYMAELKACKTDAECDAVDAEITEKCVRPIACHGTSEKTCWSYYYSACPY